MNSNTESKFIKHIPCEECGSSDGNAIYDDGHCYCHVCSTWKPSEDPSCALILEKEKPVKVNKMQIKGEVRSITDRNLSKATAEFYGVTVDGDKQYYPYTDVDGSVIAAKVRTVSTKSFSVEGDWKHATLFGQNKFNKGGKFITITEGEIDTMSAYQMMGSKWPVVSIRNGAQSAIKDVKANYEYLASFDSVVICFDNDEPGKKAAKDVAEVLGSKAKIMKLTLKDASDYLTENKAAEFTNAWWQAEQYTPDGIVAGSTLWDEVNKPMEKAAATYPWDGIQEITYGLRPSELVMVTAGSGLGKSQFLREIIWHLIKTTDSNIGLMFMEESVRKTALGVMSLAADRPLHLPDTVVSDSEKEAAFNATLGTDRLFLFDSFGSTDIDNIINRVRYLAKACDCKFIFVDHISIIVSGSAADTDERKQIDSLMTKLRTLVQETGICMIAVSHLKRAEGKGHESGAATSLNQLRGSGSIAQLSDLVIGLQRNSQAEDEKERNTTRVSVMKNRFSGLTSPHCTSLLYSKDTGRMLEYLEDNSL